VAAREGKWEVGEKSVVMGATPFYSGATEVGDGPVEAATRRHKVGEGPGMTARLRAAGNCPATMHTGRLSTSKIGEANKWGPGNSAGRRQFKFDSNSNSNGFEQVQTISNFD
jgi:hypothetical protein